MQILLHGGSLRVCQMSLFIRSVKNEDRSSIRMHRTYYINIALGNSLSSIEHIYVGKVFHKSGSMRLIVPKKCVWNSHHRGILLAFPQIKNIVIHIAGFSLTGTHVMVLCLSPSIFGLQNQDINGGYGNSPSLLWAGPTTQTALTGLGPSWLGILLSLFFCPPTTY